MAADPTKAEGEGASPGEREAALHSLYRQLDDAGIRLRRLERESSPYTRVESEMLRRRHDDIAHQIRLLIERRRTV